MLIIYCVSLGLKKKHVCMGRCDLANVVFLPSSWDTMKIVIRSDSNSVGCFNMNIIRKILCVRNNSEDS